MKRILIPMLFLASLVITGVLSSCGGKQQPQTNEQTASDSVVAVADTAVAATVETNAADDVALVKEFYGYVFGLDEKEMNEAVLDKYLTPELKKSLWTEDYDGCYAFWKFRTSAQDGNPDSEEPTAVKSVEPQGDGWYEVVYSDGGWPGTTLVRVEAGKIAEYKADKSWNSEAE